MADAHPSEQSIFLAALAKGSPQERAAYLEEACAGDARLRADVEALLAAHDRLGARPPAPAASELPLTRDEPPQAEGPGTVIGPYKLVQKLGEGGMGTVWVAEQIRPVKRRVALKVIKAGMDSAQVLRRFEAERQALALMEHAHIAKVLDAGATDTGRPYFVMELVHGVPITKYCDELNLSVRERLALFVPVCHAIQHAHQKGIIHRDIKPSNVLVCMQDGRAAPKVIDFGVAKALHQQLGEHSLYTEFGAVIGTLEYMSPEQAEMSPLGVDTRADVYALGVLLYELLTGATPLDRQRLRKAAFGEMIRLIKEEEPPRPSTKLTQSKESLAGLAAHRRTEPAKLVKELRAELDWIAMKCLEKDRSRRYESAGGLARDVERYLHDEPVEACPPSARYRLGKLWRRHRGPVLAVALVLLALLSGMAGTTWGLILAERARQAEAVQRRVAEAKEQEAVVAAAEEQRAKTSAQQAQLAEAKARQKAEDELGRSEALRLTAQSSAELHSDPGLAMLLAIEAAKRKPGLETNNALLAALDACREERTFSGHTDAVLSAQLTPDSKRIISCARDGTVRCWEAATGKQVYETPRVGRYGELLAGVVLSSDGKSFVTLYRGTSYFERDNKRIWYTDRVVRVWDASTGQQLTVLRGHTATVGTAAFSPDSRRLVTASADTTVRVWDVASGKELAVIRGHSLMPFAARFSNDGRQVLTVSGNQEQSWAGEEPSGNVDPTEIRPPAPGAYTAAHFSSGLSSSSFDSGEKLLIGVWDAETGQEITTINKPKGLLGLLRMEADGPKFGKFSPDGQRAVVGYAEPQVWDVATGKMLFKLPPHDIDVGSSSQDRVAWSPDGKRLATIRGHSVCVWDAQLGRELATLRGHESGVDTVCFSADSKWMLTTALDRTARVWDAASGDQLAVLKGHRGLISTAAFSPDRRRVVTAGHDGTVRLWQLHPPMDHARLLSWPVPDRNVMALSPDGRLLAMGTAGYLNSGLWDTASGKLRHQLRARRDDVGAKLPVRSRPPVWAVAFSADGRRLLTVADEEKIWIRKPSFFGLVDSDQMAELPFTPAHVWDVETGQQLAALPAGRFAVRCACFSPDGRKVLTAELREKNYGAYYAATGERFYEGPRFTGDQDQPTFARVYDAATAKELCKLPLGGSIYCAAFSPDGRRILTSSNPTHAPRHGICVWDAETGKLLLDLKTRGSGCVAWLSPDGRKIAVFCHTGTPSEIRIHSAETGQELARLSGSDIHAKNEDVIHAGLSPFSPDGRTLLAVVKEGPALVDVRTGQPRVVFRGHAEDVNSAVFSADGRFVVTASKDRTARVWEAATGKELYTLRHRYEVRFALMTRDGRRVATAADGVRIWDLDPLAIALRRKPRELSALERERYGIK